MEGIHESVNVLCFHVHFKQERAINMHVSM